MRVPPAAGPRRVEWTQMNIKVPVSRSRWSDTDSPSQAVISSSMFEESRRSSSVRPIGFGCSRLPLFPTPAALSRAASPGICQNARSMGIAPATDPVAPQALLPLTLQNTYRARYRAMRPNWRSSGDQLEALVRSRLTPDSRVLDLGCGRGGVVELFWREVKVAAGLDPDAAS